MQALMKSPTGNGVPRMVKSEIRKILLTHHRAMNGVKRSFVRAVNHAAESRANHHAHGHVYYVSTKDEFLKSV